MKLTSVAVLAVAFTGCYAAAQSQPSAQASSSAESKTSVKAGSPGVQASSGTSASASGQAGQSSASLASGTTVNATLSSPVDTKKNKPGDRVEAKTAEAVKSEGSVVVPKGSKLVGHVTQAKTRAKGESESALGIQFDKAILKNGQEIPLNVTIQAIAAAQSAASVSAADDAIGAGGGAAATGRATGGGVLGGVTSSAGGTIGAVSNTAANVGGAASGTISSTANAAGAARGAVGGLNAAGQLTSNSKGVFGLNGMNLNSAVSSSSEASVITSAGKNVHLDSGTRLLLVAQGQAEAGATKQQ